MAAILLDLPVSQVVLLVPILIFIYNYLRSHVVQFQRNRKAKRLGCQPVPLAPTRLPFGIDGILDMIKAGREMRVPEYICSRHEAMGRFTWRQKVLGSEFFTTADPKNIQAILATQFSDFRLGIARRTNLSTVLGGSVFALDGPAWQEAREVIRPLFSREQVSDLPLLEHHFQELLQCMPVNSNGWTDVVSLNALFPSLMMDAATELFLGKSSGALAKKAVKIHSGKGLFEDEVEEDFEWAFNRSQEILTMRLRLQSFWWLYGSKELKKCVSILHQLCDQAIDEVTKSRKANPDSIKGYDFLSAMMARSESHAATRDHVVGLLAAGRDTTAALTSWVFYCLVRHPDVLIKLRAVIAEAFGADATAITFSGLKACTYLQQVLNETLRLHSVVPFNSRSAVRDTTLPMGGGADGMAPIFIPEGTEINFSTHVVQRRHDLWGEDADDFVPARWEKKRPGWNYVPFNGGPRVCIGQQYALTEAGYVVARIIQEFDVIEGVDIDPTRDYSNFQLFCSPGPGRDSVKAGA